MSESDLARLDRDALVALFLKQAIASLQAKIEELTRSGKRQAAPFSNGARVKTPNTSSRPITSSACLESRGLPT